MNSITNCLAHDIENFLYVDDFDICFRSRYMHIAERKLHPEPSLLLNNHLLPVVNKVKFLGLYFDNKLLFCLISNT